MPEQSPHMQPVEVAYAGVCSWHLADIDLKGFGLNYFKVVNVIVSYR